MFESLEGQTVEKENLDTFLNQVDEETKKIFVGIIFDETEENHESMSKSHFLNKYKMLLRLLEPLESDCDEDKNGNNKNDSPCMNKSLKNASKRPSSIIKEEKSYDIHHNDNSIQDLFNEFKFDSERKGSSVVQPSNSFKFAKVEKLLAIESTFNNRDFLLKSPKNLENLQDERLNEFNETEIVNKESPPQFINYQNNININFNNYGPINPAVNSLRGNNISQKLQEVYFEINKPDKYFRIKRNDENFKFRAAMNKLEDLISFKKDTFLTNFNPSSSNSLSRKKEDYFTDLCKSIHIENKYNKNLRNISDRVLKKNRKDPRDINMIIGDHMSNILTEKKTSLASINLENIEDQINTCNRSSVPSRLSNKSKLSSSNRLILEKLIEKNLENCAFQDGNTQIDKI
jgi:hypothetical protein